MKPSVDKVGRFVPLFIANWRDALFVHFRVDPAVLRRRVPLDLDLYDGHAYISVVAFTQVGLRPTFGGKMTEWFSTPLATHDFLNVRTYVRHGDDRGIFFLSEWIPNPLAVFLGPRLYGLPYRLGELSYSSGPDGQLIRKAQGAGGHLSCQATVDSTNPRQPCPVGSESHFLLERYTAFTCRHDVLRRFRIRHEPWMQSPAMVDIRRRDLLDDFVTGDPCAAQFSSGVKDVAIGRPERIRDGESRAMSLRTAVTLRPTTPLRPHHAEFL